MPGHIKARTKHHAPLQQANMAEQFWKHNEAAHYWIAWAETLRDFKAVMLNTEVIKSIETVHGPEVAQALRDTVKLFTDGGVQEPYHSVYSLFWRNITQAVATVTLAFKLSTVMNQADAGGRHMLRLSIKQQRQALQSLFSGDFFKKYRKAFKSESIQSRLEKGSNPIIRMVRENRSALPSNIPVLGKLLRLSEMAVEAGFWPIQESDARLTTLSGAVIYEDAFNRAKEAGMSDAEADVAAADEMDRVVFETAQPAEMAQKSLLENTSNALTRSLMMFMSDQRLKYAAWGEAYARLVKGENRMEQIRIITALGIMGMMGELMRGLYRDWFTDDDDEEIWNAKNFGRAFALGPLNGFFVVGTILDSLVSHLIGDHVFSRINLVDQVQRDAFKLLNKPEALVDFSDDKASRRAWMAAARIVGSVHVAGTLPALVVNVMNPIIGLHENLEKDDD